MNSYKIKSYSKNEKIIKEKVIKIFIIHFSLIIIVFLNNLLFNYLIVLKIINVLLHFWNDNIYQMN